MNIGECKRCGNKESFTLQYGSTHTGLMCGCCGSWISWVGKKKLPEIERYIKMRKVNRDASHVDAINRLKLNLKDSISRLGLSKEEVLGIVTEIFE